MAVPKKKQSKTRGDKRAANWKAKAPAVQRSVRSASSRSSRTACAATAATTPAGRPIEVE